MNMISRRNILIRAMASLVAMASAPLLVHPARGNASSPKVHHVEISGFKFNPEVLAVKPGDTIIWTNQDIAPHTATALDNSWDTGTIAQGKSKKIEVTSNFSPEYFCRFHPQMQAKLQIALD